MVKFQFIRGYKTSLETNPRDFNELYDLINDSCMDLVKNYKLKTNSPSKEKEDKFKFSKGKYVGSLVNAARHTNILNEADTHRIYSLKQQLVITRGVTDISLTKIDKYIAENNINSKLKKEVYGNLAHLLN